MAIRTKLNNGVTNLNSASGWDPSGVPDVNDAMTFGAGFPAGTVNLTNNAQIITGQLWVSDAGAANTTWSVSGGASNNLLYNGNTSSGVPSYTIYIDDNRSFVYNQSVGVVNTAGVTSHSIYIGAGGNLECSWFITSSSGTQVSVTKYGAGDFRLRTTNNTTNAMNVLTIVAGRVRNFGGNTGTIASSVVFPAGSTGELNFYSTGGGTANPPITFNGNGIVSVETGTVTFAGGATGIGTMTVSGAGTAAWNNTISCPLNVTGALTMSGTNSITSSTLTGTGNITMSGGNLGPVTATAYTGTIGGTVVVAGTRTVTTNVFSNRFSGNTALAASASATFAGTNTSGYLTTIPSGASALVTGTFTGTTSNVALTGTLALSGTAASIANAITFTGGTLNLSSGASCVVAATSGADATVPTFAVTDASSCTYSGNLTATSATGGSINYRAAAGGKLTLTGSHSTASAKPFALNSLPANTGTIVVSGAGMTGATATLSYGKLAVVGGSSNSNLRTVGSSLTVAGNATLAFSGAPRFNTNLTLQANSTVQFATAA